MNSNDTGNGASRFWRQIRHEAPLWLFGITLVVALTAIFGFNLVRSTQVAVTLGQPSPTEVLAPRSINYYSEVLTEQAREQARARVADVYSTPDVAIARAQLNQVRSIFNFVEVVRADSHADLPSRQRYLQQIEGITVDPEIASLLLAFSAEEFNEVRNDIDRIVENVMRQEIRDDATALGEARRAARTQFSLTLSQAQERVVTALAPQFIVANSFFNEEATTQQRAEAAAAVEPRERTVVRDQPVIRVGDTVTEEHLEALERLGLLQREISWGLIGSIFFAVILAVGLIVLYWYRFRGPLINSPRYLTVLGGLIIIFALGARLLVPGSGSYAYLFPSAALAMLLAVIFDVRLALFVSIVLAFLTGIIARESLELAVFMAMGPLFAALTLRDAQRVNAFFRAGLVAALANMVVIFVFRLGENVETIEILELLLFSVLNGIISASVTLAGFFVVGGLFGMMTTLQLQELSRLDHPLLRELLRRAPGTYHHSIMVANLAEQGAERVGANSTLVRVGAFYHDVGKMLRPPFYTENQEGINPHETLDPYSSARIIISHVRDGVELARKYRLPDRIRDFIAEHHGDRVVYVFFKKAQEQAGEGEKVDESRFRYDGPRPRSRESGIVLLADSIEAASAAVRPNSAEAIETLVNKIVDDHLKDGQLDDSGLTLGDIRELRDSFITTVKGRFHVRVRYPGDEALEPPVPRGHPVTPQDAPVPAVPQSMSSPLLTPAQQRESQ
jgi:cyclic-di-AMP phosphodiesterase PgpH